MREISMTCYEKQNNKWIKTYSCTDEKKIYQDVFNALLHKKIHRCTYITMITDRTNYDGTRTIEVYYNNGFKYVYIVED